MSRWVWGTEQARAPPIQQSPPLFLGSPPLLVEVDCLPSMAGLLLWRGLLFPHCSYCLLRLRHRGPLSSLSHDSHPFLEGQLGSWREQVV